ncbi:helix-turn-helix transcriptional regulator [Maritalea porphyrae]|uniref:HTH luxR-type domain-containing protein n=1 Tax=Maritalea porphyrae TaxID=880732 RepID=A0ABQ5UUI2_9HYPH|nr:LuxR family transcriptional regulator [Maritalea porphyrae]GLQ18044.1 hypothetical protein GCM10007879_22930 [Maritalea porphyrae]
MPSSLEFAQDLFRAKTRTQIWQDCQTFFAQFGFDGLIYLDATAKGVYLLSNLPSDWLDHYVEQQYEKIDPFLTLCCATNQTTLTGSAFLHRYNYLRRDQKQLINEAGETGYIAGFASPFRLLGPNGAGGWNLLSEMPAKDVEATMQQHGDTLQLAAMFAHTAIGSANAASPTEALTAREQEAMCWLAAGLRGQQIAHRMGLAAVTVDFHLKNARTKLGAQTREQALAIAISKGLISI